MSAYRRNLASRGVLRRKVRTSDGQGGWTEVYADVALDVPCRRRPAGERDRIVADQLQATVAHVVSFLPDQDVQRGDQLAVDGYELQVESTTKPARPVYLAAACSETQMGA